MWAWTMGGEAVIDALPVRARLSPVPFEKWAGDRGGEARRRNGGLGCWLCPLLGTRRNPEGPDKKTARNVKSPVEIVHKTV